MMIQILSNALVAISPTLTVTTRALYSWWIIRIKIAGLHTLLILTKKNHLFCTQWVDHSKLPHLDTTLRQLTRTPPRCLWSMHNSLATQMCKCLFHKLKCTPCSSWTTNIFRLKVLKWIGKKKKKRNLAIKASQLSRKTVPRTRGKLTHKTHSQNSLLVAHPR